MTSPTPATRREWIGLAIIALPCMVYAMDLTVLNLAIPALSAELRPTSAQLLWIIDIYGFMVAGLLVTMGTLGDRIGRRKLLLIGAAAFAVASALAATARTAETLIAMRALLGVAGATLAPSTMSLIRNMFHVERERQFAIGVWIASFSFGGVIGPLVGGVLIEWFAWPAVFLVAVPVMLMLLVLGPVLLPEYRDPDAGRIDVASVLLSLAAVLSTIFGLKQLAEGGPSIPAFACLLAGIGLGVAFVRRQGRIPYPLLDLSLFARPVFCAAITAYALSCLSMMGLYIFITQYLQLVLALSPIEAGIATIPWGLAFIAGSLAAPWLAARTSPQRLLVGGLLIGAAGTAIQGLATVLGGLPVLIIGTLVMSLALAPVFTIGNELIITSAPPERAGSASAVSETSSEFSGALGIAVFGSLGTALYRQLLEGRLPAGLAGDTTSDARASLGGAIAIAAGLEPATGAALADAARAAFLLAFQAAAIVSALVMLGAAIAAGILLRRDPATRH